jgi:peptide deformylase
MIKTDPYETLYTVSTEVKPEEMREVRNLANRTLTHLRKTRGGVGLAANQVGDTRRWFVSQTFKTVINPEILEKSEETETQEEGCLSKPGYRRMVKRPAVIRVRWTSGKGTEINRQLKGLPARIFQHELDHLDGKNIWQV